MYTRTLKVYFLIIAVVIFFVLSASASDDAVPDSNLTNPVNVLDFGADPTGHKDSTDAIKAALKKSKHIYFPQGTYLIDRLSISGSVTLQGDGDNCTVLRTGNLKDNVVVFKDDGWHVKDMKFDATSDRTGGAYIFSSSDYASIENVSLNRYYIGIDLDGSWSVNISNITASYGTASDIAEGGAVIRLGKNAYTGPINIRGLTARGTSSTQQPSSGIQMGYVDVVSISDALIIWHNADVLISPTGRKFAALVEITNCCFDTAVSGIVISPSRGARVLRCGISNTWFGAHSSDAVVIDGNDGTITGIQFSNSMFLANSGNGVTVRGGGVDGIYFSNCFSGGNSNNGLQIGGNAKDVIWNGGVLGSCHELDGNLKYGCYVDGECDGRLLLVDVSTNGLGAIYDSKGQIDLFGCTLK